MCNLSGTCRHSQLVGAYYSIYLLPPHKGSRPYQLKTVSGTLANIFVMSKMSFDHNTNFKLLLEFCFDLTMLCCADSHARLVSRDLPWRWGRDKVRGRGQ